MDEQTIKEKLKYEIDQADEGLLAYVSEAIISYKTKNINDQEHKDLVLEKALEIGVKQGKGKNLKTWTEFLSDCQTDSKLQE